NEDRPVWWPYTAPTFSAAWMARFQVARLESSQIIAQSEVTTAPTVVPAFSWRATSSMRGELVFSGFQSISASAFTMSLGNVITARSDRARSPRKIGMSGMGRASGPPNGNDLSGRLAAGGNDLADTLHGLPQRIIK